MMYEKFKISVIVPVYNVEKYVKRCIDSIVNQSYENLEIILIDDGSTDLSHQICDDLAKKDSRIIVVHKENGGLSSARNTGLDIATGDYIYFIDSDDWVALDTFQYAMNLIDKYNLDAVEFEYRYVSSTSEKIKERKEKIKILEGKDILQNYMYATTVRGNYSVCICLFKSTVLKGIRFREGKIAEDGDFKYLAYKNCSRIVCSNQLKYFYYQSGNSISTGGLKQKDFELYEAADVLYDLAKNETYGSIQKLARVKKARTAMSLLSRIAVYGFSD